MYILKCKDSYKILKYIVETGLIIECSINVTLLIVCYYFAKFIQSIIFFQVLISSIISILTIFYVITTILLFDRKLFKTTSKLNQLFTNLTLFSLINILNILNQILTIAIIINKFYSKQTQNKIYYNYALLIICILLIFETAIAILTTLIRIYQIYKKFLYLKFKFI